MLSITIKSIYEPFLETDGYRILVDPQLPRGVKKTGLPIDKRMKSVAPSIELRRWLNGDPGNWDTFKVLYRNELTVTGAFEELLLEIGGLEKVTLLFAAQNEYYNHANALCEFLNYRLSQTGVK
jgi:uncharacterized protein YeaO (DUF488 family)